MSHRATTIDFDLNLLPPDAVELQEVFTVEPSNAPIDLDAADDEVIVLSSLRGSSRVGNPAGAPPPATILIDEDTEVQQEEAVTRLTLNSFNGHTITQAAPPKRTIVNCDLDCLDSEHEGKKARGEEEPKPNNEEKKEPTFSCTICWGPLVEETSTNCGHIFCQSCIKKAIKIHKRCPTCRKSINMKSIHRIYFPAAE